VHCSSPPTMRAFTPDILDQQLSHQAASIFSIARNQPLRAPT
jgi:hypothetical protein